MRQPLSDRELEVLVFIKEFHRDNDQIPPTMVLSKHFAASQNAGMYWCLSLLRKGYLERNAVGKFRFSRTQEASHV